MCVLGLTIPEIGIIEACAAAYPHVLVVERDSAAELIERGFVTVAWPDPRLGAFVILTKANMEAIESASDSAIAARPEWPLMEPE